VYSTQQVLQQLSRINSDAQANVAVTPNNGNPGTIYNQPINRQEQPQQVQGFRRMLPPSPYMQGIQSLLEQRRNRLMQYFQPQQPAYQPSPVPTPTSALIPVAPAPAPVPDNTYYVDQAAYQQSGTPQGYIYDTRQHYRNPQSLPTNNVSQTLKHYLNIP
jgi:hypothetical protein